MGVKRPKPAIAPGTPRAPSNNFTQQINLQFTKNYATSRLLGPGRNPVRPLERSHVQSVSRYSAPSLTNKLYIIDRAPPPRSRAQLAPRPGNSGTPESPCLSSTSKHFTIIYSQRNNSEHSKETNTFRNLA